VEVIQNMNTDASILSLERQLECYRRLAKLSAAQRELVQQSRTEELLELLTRRQQVLDEIAAHEEIVGLAKREWSAFIGGLEPATRGRAEAMLVETRQLLEEITSADRDDALILQQRKLNLGRQMNAAASARQVNRTYAAAAYGSRPSNMDVQR
jgi:hypothetical protein